MKIGASMRLTTPTLSRLALCFLLVAIAALCTYVATCAVVGISASAKGLRIRKEVSRLRSEQPEEFAKLFSRCDPTVFETRLANVTTGDASGSLQSHVHQVPIGDGDDVLLVVHSRELREHDVFAKIDLHTEKHRALRMSLGHFVAAIDAEDHTYILSRWCSEIDLREIIQHEIVNRE